MMIKLLTPTPPNVADALAKARAAIESLHAAEDTHATNALLARIEAEEALKRADAEQDSADRAARVRGRLEDLLA